MNRDYLNNINKLEKGGLSGKPIEKIAEDTDRDFYMSAVEAKEYGVVDDVLLKPPAPEDDDDDDEQSS